MNMPGLSGTMCCLQLATRRPNEGICSNCFNAIEFKLDEALKIAAGQHSIFCHIYFSWGFFFFAWLCKTFVPINDLLQQRRCRKLIWAPLQILWRPWSLIRFQRGFWGSRDIGTERGKTLHKLICLSFHFNIAHSDCSFFEKRPFALSVFLVNEGNLLNSISSLFLSLSMGMPMGFERYRTSPRKCIFMRDPGLCFH